jgi:hypothetical protein
MNLTVDIVGLASWLKLGSPDFLLACETRACIGRRSGPAMRAESQTSAIRDSNLGV